MSIQKRTVTVVLPFFGLALMFAIFEVFYGQRFGDHSSQKFAFGAFFFFSTLFGIFAFSNGRYFRPFVIANGVLIFAYLSLWISEQIFDISGWMMISHLFVFTLSIPITFALSALIFRTAQSSHQGSNKSEISSPITPRVD
jgi:hypothetical protein